MEREREIERKRGDLDERELKEMKERERRAGSGEVRKGVGMRGGEKVRRRREGEGVAWLMAKISLSNHGK